MPYNNAIHNRQSIRLNGFDYSQEGNYFITICAHNRQSLFGKIIKEDMEINQVGNIVNFHWQKIPNRFKGIQLGAFVIMPNHIHGIITFTESIPGQTIGKIVGAFKSLTANEFISLCKRNKLPVKKLWQRNYYDHIIRDEEDYFRIVDYIQNNPKNWENDQYR
jgi:REP element-mobilizing transposase RayT